LKKILKIDSLSYDEIKILLGNYDENLKLISELFDVGVYYRNNELIIEYSNEAVFNKVENYILLLIKYIKEKATLNKSALIYTYRKLDSNEINSSDFNSKIIARTENGKPLICKTLGQKKFVELVKSKDVTFAIGPAGTGKTYLAVVLAVVALKKGDCKKIVLTRPAVEAGESLGFLPGDLKEKVDPYLIPLYDGLRDMLGFEQTEKLIEKGIIEIAPLAYMRGRTLNDSYVILDEAQNTTSNQMKMFLTRLGFNSKMVITGDITQIDLNKNQKSGLKDAFEKLNSIEEIGFIHLTADDVVRNPLVQKIIEAY